MRRALLLVAVFALPACELWEVEAYIGRPLTGPERVSFERTESMRRNRELGHAMMRAVGWNDTDIACIDFIVARESAWLHTATGALGDYGIPQSYPAEKLAAAGPNWRTSPATQIRWMLMYVTQRYGTACAAKRWKATYGWY